MSLSESQNAWQKKCEKELSRLGKTIDSITHKTSEGIDIQPVYHSGSLPSGANSIDQFAGTGSFRRGPYASMYTSRPWTIRQYAGFSTARESNAFYRNNLKSGQKGLSVAFDLPTHRGYDSDNPRIASDVGKAGVAIDSVEDMKILFDGIPLQDMSVSMTMNGAVIPILASYIVAAEEMGAPQSTLRGTIQNDILKEYMVRNTYIYPPEPSMRIVGDIIEYTSKNMPLYNSISISGYHIQEAGGNAALELAFTLADGIEYVQEALGRGLHIDDFAPRLSFFFGIGMNFFMEIAKLRAARVLWSELISEFNPSSEKSKILRTHCQTSGYSLSEQDPYNNVIRTTIEAMAAVLGGTQSLHTNAYDEATCLPTPQSARIARNTQLILQHETDLTHTIDPLGGSYFVESLTEELIAKAKSHINEIKANGGMVKAIMSGHPKQKIEEAAALRQAEIDSKKKVIVGVNKYQAEDDSEFDVLEIDNDNVLKEQMASLKSLKEGRDSERCEQSLAAISRAAKEGNNLMPHSIEAIRNRCTIGEISLALEKVWGRYQAETTLVQNVYSKHFQNTEEFQAVKTKVEELAKSLGRRPRILVAKIGQDGHDRGAKVVASGFADMGFDVDVGPLFQTPQEIGKQAIENDVHVIGISSQAGAHKSLTQELKKYLQANDSDDIIVIVGGVIPRKDYKFLRDAGASEIFGPGVPIVESANKVLDLIKENFVDKSK